LPVVLAHGFLGFDEVAIGARKHAYFRGIEARLTQMGAKVYTPRVPAAASIATRAQRLADLIRALPEPRVNIVAHSMGGLDARYALAQLGLSDKVASLTTIATPHLGTPLADVGSKLLARVVRLFGRLFDLRAFVDLTTAQMDEFNRSNPNVAGVSYGSVIARSTQLRTHPLLWATHRYLTERAGPNDGVVPSASQPWGDVLREIDADHWAQIGWTRTFDAEGLYEALLQDLRGRGF
jgi:triacylglycerol lipase